MRFVWLSSHLSPFVFFSIEDRMSNQFLRFLNNSSIRRLWTVWFRWASVGSVEHLASSASHRKVIEKEFFVEWNCQLNRKSKNILRIHEFPKRFGEWTQHQLFQWTIDCFGDPKFPRFSLFNLISIDPIQWQRIFRFKFRPQKESTRHSTSRSQKELVRDRYSHSQNVYYYLWSTMITSKIFKLSET